MAFVDDAANLIAGEVTALSLHTSSPGTTGTNEISGGGYARRVPNYAAASGGVANLSATLEYDGPANGGPVTHVGFWRGATFWRGRAVGTQRSFNSDGRLNLSSAPITASVTD
jgi:hypothetical protein